ncbi:MAG: hypothetical protein J5802_04945 [Butyrivibrio sp.]|nr:hypothetical protein [Butyrivibrio sp.]
MRYMRIQGREDSYVTKYPKGVFSLCWNLIRDDVLEPEEKEMFISIDNWFKENLPEPEPCKNHEKVITFFKCGSTSEMYEKLKPAIALLNKYNTPYDVVYTDFIGTVVYEDNWQVAVRVEDGKMI